MIGYKVTILADHEAGDGFELLGTFTVEAIDEDDAIDKGFNAARSQYPNVGDMQLDMVSYAS